MSVVYIFSGMSPAVLFLSWGSPWPAHFGGALRTLGLLTELSQAFTVELVVLAREPLRADQRGVLAGLSTRLTELPLRDVTLNQRLRAALRGVVTGRPYHCALVESSFRAYPDERRRIRAFPGVVYASYGHWGTLVRPGAGHNWILDQQHAPFDFWRAYRSLDSSPAGKLFAAVNERLARRHFKHVYASMGRVVSVCEEDRRLVLQLTPGTTVAVIRNGVDCRYFEPHRTPRPRGRRLLFCGTSSPHNMTALTRFATRILPLVRATLKDVQLIVAGDFDTTAQAALAREAGVRFTGAQDDLRAEYDRCDLFVVPHERTHGSQTKVAVAMAMGMAVVASPEGIRGLPLVDGESVLLARDDHAFGAAVTRLLHDGAKRQQLGAAARRVAVECLDWRVVGGQAVSLVEEVVRDVA